MLPVAARALTFNNSVRAVMPAECLACATALPGQLLSASSRPGATSCEHLLQPGVALGPCTAADLAARLRDEATKWAKRIKEANFRPTEQRRRVSRVKFA